MNTSILHVFPSFGLGGVPILMAKIINALGPKYHHSIVALNGCKDSARYLSPSIDLDFLPVGIGLTTFKMIRAAHYVLKRQTPSLLVTHNWGSIEWALASLMHPYLPHLHYESGFGVEEADRQLWRRIWTRRIALRFADRVVVPSKSLLYIANTSWKVRLCNIRHIPNGVDCRAFEKAMQMRDQRDRTSEHLTIGTLGPLRPEKNIRALLDIFHRLRPYKKAHLLIAGIGPEQPQLERQVSDLNMAQQVTFLGHTTDVQRALAEMDIYTLTSDTEQMPLAVLEAMASGLPVIAFDVGDVREMLSPPNRAFVVDRRDKKAFQRALMTVASDASLRRSLGHRNRDHVQTEYDWNKAIGAQVRLLGASIRKSTRK